MQINSVNLYSKIPFKKVSPKSIVQFRGNEDDKLFDASLLYHKGRIYYTDPLKVEKYFESKGVKASFREGDEYARKMVAYCAYNASEIFEQLKYVKPRYVGIADFDDISPGDSNSTGLCSVFPFETKKGVFFHERSTFFNIYPLHRNSNGKKTVVSWYDFPQECKKIGESNHWSTEHFMGAFIHEFAHSMHYDHIYKKYGAPKKNMQYEYNPKCSDILKNMRMPIKNGNKFVIRPVKKMIDTNISAYGSSTLPETFAEAFTKAVIANIDLFSLRLKKNPFPMIYTNPIITDVLSETYDGKVGDKKGIV